MTSPGLPPLISSDGHLEVRPGRWSPRMPAKYRDRAPRTIKLPDGGDALLVEGQPPYPAPFLDLRAGRTNETWEPFGVTVDDTAGVGPPEQRLREQDQDALHAEVLFPNMQVGPRLWRAIPDDDVYRATVRAYNDWLGEEYCAVSRDRLIGLGVIPWTNVSDAVAELEHCAKLGLKGVNLGVFPSGKGYPTPDDDKFWAAAIDMNMPIAAHHQFDRTEDRGGPLVRFETRKEILERMPATRGFAEHVSLFAREGGVNAIQLALTGVFDRFPKLQLFVVETQIGWIPFFLEMADARYERHAGWAQRLLNWTPIERQPSDYVRDHCSWGFQHDRTGIEMRHKIGVDKLIWAVDFPHQDSDWPHSMELVKW